MNYKISFHCTSHIGKIRKVNQDNFLCNGKFMQLGASDSGFLASGEVITSSPRFFGVFDGMGGEECGEVASFIAASEASQIAFTQDGANDLLEYCVRANTAICDYTVQNGIKSMGTTAAILLFANDKITLCNVGDSKVFRFSDKELTQISHDHVVILPYGKKPPLSQNLGIPPEEMLIEPYISQGVCKNNDKYLICSDGLTDMVSEEEIKKILKSQKCEKATETLLSKALENGGRDNVTFILLEIKQIKNKLFNFFKKNTEELKNDM